MPLVTIEELDKYFINSDSEKIYLKQRELTLEILREIKEIQKSCTVNDKQKELIESCLESNYEWITYTIIGKSLSKLAAKEDSIKRFLLELSSSSKATVRFNNIVNAQLLKDKELKKSIYNLGLKDKSQKVLEKTIEDLLLKQKISKDFLPQIENAISRINSNESKKFLNTILKVNQKGYCVEKDGNNYIFYVKIKGGLKSWTITEEEFKKIKIIRLYILKEQIFD
ncbi:MAG: hypothetical protein J6Y30_01100 [Treponema sp.]|nr:hypothetical protein [Treponema sp.]